MQKRIEYLTTQIREVNERMAALGKVDPWGYQAAVADYNRLAGERMSDRVRPTMGAKHIGARYGGLADYARRDNTATNPRILEEAEDLTREKGYIQDAYDLGEFRTGWYIGLANGAISDLHTWMKYLRRDEIEQMGNELRILADKYRAILDRSSR